MVGAERTLIAAHRPGRKRFGFFARPVSSQIQRQVGGTAERQRVLFAEQAGQSGQRSLTQGACLRGVTQDRKVTGQVDSDGEREEMVTSQPGISARPGPVSLSLHASTGVSGQSVQQGKVSHTAVVVGVLSAIDGGVVIHRGSSQSERLDRYARVSTGYSTS